MSCGGKACQKLWKNYLDKYGDFRERSRLIRNDQQCLMEFRLPHIQQRASKLPNRSELIDSNRKLPKKCDSSLPPDCCHSLRMKNNLSLLLNQSDREKLEKLIEAEDFPEYIFAKNKESRLSLDNETELSMTNNLHRLVSTSNQPITQSGQGLSDVTSANDPTVSRATNPYRQLIQRLRNTGKTKNEKSDTELIRPSFVSTIDVNTHNRIEQFLSFLHSLDDPTDRPLDENTLINLFSADNHLSSSLYVPMNIQQLNSVPISILQSLKTTPENEPILNQIEAEISRKTPRHRSPNIKQKQSYFNTDFQISHFVEQDKELDSRLSKTYIIKAFKDYLIQQNKSARLPKLFHDLETN